MNDQSKAVDIRIGERLQQAESSLSQRTGRAIAAREICAMVRDRYGVPLSPLWWMSGLMGLCFIWMATIDLIGGALHRILPQKPVRMISMEE